jgi:hypothetical protein
VLRGEISGSDLWRELKLINQLGVTRGQMETTPQLIQRKTGRAPVGLNSAVRSDHGLPGAGPP